jgi:hypothetical protein
MLASRPVCDRTAADEEQVLVAGVAALRRNRPGITVIVEEMSASQIPVNPRSNFSSASRCRSMPIPSVAASFTSAFAGAAAAPPGAPAQLSSSSVSTIAAAEAFSIPVSNNPRNF